MFWGVGLLNFAQTRVLLVGATLLLWRMDPALPALTLVPSPLRTVLVLHRGRVVVAQGSQRFWPRGPVVALYKLQFCSTPRDRAVEDEA